MLEKKVSTCDRYALGISCIFLPENSTKAIAKFCSDLHVGGRYEFELFLSISPHRTEFSKVFFKRDLARLNMGYVPLYKSHMVPYVDSMS